MPQPELRPVGTAVTDAIRNQEAPRFPTRGAIVDLVAPWSLVAEAMKRNSLGDASIGASCSIAWMVTE